MREVNTGKKEKKKDRKGMFPFMIPPVQMF